LRTWEQKICDEWRILPKIVEDGRKYYRKTDL
jgi:hypothetical protein